jgi:hypothetical protein
MATAKHAANQLKEELQANADKIGAALELDEFIPDENLPIHYLDDAGGQQRGECPHSGGSRNSLGGCPRGCAGATQHYANDGHAGCADV